MVGTLVHDGLLQVFDVNHGGCALLTLPTLTGVKRILIDCGHSDTARLTWYPARHLRGLGVTHVDTLFAMNFDEDHASGFVDLLKQGLTIGSIYGNPSVPPEVVRYLKTEDGMGAGIAALTNAIGLRRHSGLQEALPQFPGLATNVCWNVYPRFQDENNLSLILELQVRGFSFLFTGDMEKAGFTNLLTGYPPFRDMVRRTHVLMASHHGRRNGICQDMFDVYGCKPVLAVISDDYKQYESQETTNYYRNKVIGYRGFRGQDVRHVLTTRKDGEIQFSFRNGNCFVE